MPFHGRRRFAETRDKHFLEEIKLRIQKLLARLPLHYEISPDAKRHREEWYAALPTTEHVKRLDTIGLIHVLRSLHQQRAQIRIALFADVQLRFALSRFSASRPQSQIASRLLPKRCGSSSVNKNVSAISVPTPLICLSSSTCG